ncbi:MAG: GDYXXLXY domain-containing protein [Elusimicrobiota bacterium]|nr:GDYXXLXY domain-containing protein [Elusimicrobiota bacterium]
MSRKNITFCIAGLWLVLALGLIGYKQRILATGIKVLLETVPVDPRDFLRGDYVILRYKISSLSGIPGKSDFKRGDRVYVKLEPGAEYWEAVAMKAKNEIERGDVVIKGKIQRGGVVKYGIESYFVPEGKGREIEKNMAGRSKVAVEVIVDKNGNGIINKLFIDGQEVQL